MGLGPGKVMRKLYGLVILLVILQAIGIGLVIRFAADGIERDRTLLERTGAMMDEVFPGLKSDVSEVSQKATEIQSGIADLKTQVSKVDRHVGKVGQDVTLVGEQVAGMDQSLTGFVGDKTGLIWGHSVNPYVLIGLLILLAVSVPLCVRFFGKRSLSQPPKPDDVTAFPVQSFSGSLDRLSDLVEKISNVRKPNPELEKLMDETERLIQEARSELGDLAPLKRLTPRCGEDGPDKLH